MKMIELATATAADINPQALEFARNGAAWLDVVNPGWDATVNLTKLNLQSPEHCVLGQVYEEHGKTDPYKLGPEAFPTTGYDWASEHLLDRDSELAVVRGFLSGGELDCLCDWDFETETCDGGCESCFVCSYDAEFPGYKELDFAWSWLINARRKQREAEASYAENLAYSGGFVEGYISGYVDAVTQTPITTVRDIAARL